MQWRLILTLILMVLVVIFSLANAAAVPFNYLIGKKDVSLSLIIIISALIGAIAAVIAGLSNQLKLSRELEEKNQQIRQGQRRIEDLQRETGISSRSVYDQQRDRRSPENKSTND